MATSTTTTAPARRKNFLSSSNSKLGPLIAAWSIPAILTCPGASTFCRKICYALKSRFSSKHVQTIYEANLASAKEPGFALKMIHEIRRGRMTIVRIHVSGDFYDLLYLAAWHQIALGCPHVKFFTYTRSWRVADLLPGLVAFGALPNVDLWWSEDRDTGPSPRVPGIRTCIVVRDVSDESLVRPGHHDLVFRDAHHRSIVLNPKSIKRVAGVLVCPHEQNPQKRGKYATSPAWREPLTCSQCRVCFSPPRPLSQSGLNPWPRSSNTISTT